MPQSASCLNTNRPRAKMGQGLASAGFGASLDSINQEHGRGIYSASSATASAPRPPFNLTTPCRVNSGEYP